MRNFYVKDILKSCNGQLISGRQDYPINNISIDSRTIQKGAFFFALKGANFDGHNFISQAVEKGAAGIIFENYENIPLDIAAIKVENTLTALGLAAKAYRRRFKNIKIAAITGSNGKTTTKEMLYSILSRKAKTAANKGNFNNQIGLPLSLFELDEDCKYAVFELGTSGFGEIDVLGSILSPNAAAITNIGYSHLESFESPAGVFKEKVNLFKYIDNKGLAAINADDVFLSRVERGDFYKSVSFSISQEADVYAKSFLFSGDGTSFKLYCGSESIDIKIPQLGTFFIQDAVCAAALAFGLGFSLEEIEAGLSNYNPPKMRMETIILPSGAIFINDAYNANPSSMKESIRTVCETYPQKEINLVLGDMLELGSKSAYYHKELGAFADRFKLKSVYLIGAEMLAAKDEFKNCEARYFDDSGKLLDSLERANFNSKNAVFLFKSSRAVQLEKIVDCLIKGHSAAQTEFKF